MTTLRKSDAQLDAEAAGVGEVRHIVIWADHKHWWQRFWARLRGNAVLYSGPVLPPEAVDLNADTVKIVWDKSGRFWIVPPDEVDSASYTTGSG